MTVAGKRSQGQKKRRQRPERRRKKSFERESPKRNSGKKINFLTARFLKYEIAADTRPILIGDRGASGAILLENQQYWSVRKLEVSNPGSSAAKKMGILVRNESVGMLSGIEVSNCFIHDVVGDMANYRDGKESGGIVFVITAANLAVPSRWNDIRLVNNTVRDVARNGILMQSQWINKPQDPNSSWRGHGPYTTSTNIRIGSH